jgi:hypothetical protein
MEMGNPGDAVRAKADMARRHARDVRDEAREQRTRTIDQREAEAKAVATAADAAAIEAEFLYCGRCHATWDGDAIKEATRRRPVCLLCGGPLVAAPTE